MAEPREAAVEARQVVQVVAEAPLDGVREAVEAGWAVAEVAVVRPDLPVVVAEAPVAVLGAFRGALSD